MLYLELINRNFVKFCVYVGKLWVKMLIFMWFYFIKCIFLIICIVYDLFLRSNKIVVGLVEYCLLVIIDLV